MWFNWGHEGDLLPRVMCPLKDNQISRKSCCRCHECGADPTVWPGSGFDPLPVGQWDGSTFFCLSPTRIWDPAVTKVVVLFKVGTDLSSEGGAQVFRHRITFLVRPSICQRICHGNGPIGAVPSATQVQVVITKWFVNGIAQIRSRFLFCRGYFCIGRSFFSLFLSFHFVILGINLIGIMIRWRIKLSGIDIHSTSVGMSNLGVPQVPERPAWSVSLVWGTPNARSAHGRFGQQLTLRVPSLMPRLRVSSWRALAPAHFAIPAHLHTVRVVTMG